MRGWMLVVVALGFGCGSLFYRRDPVTAPDKPVNLADVNSPFDDFNAAKPAQMQDLIYSTNRGSDGKHLDVWQVGMYWDKNPRTTNQPRPFQPALMSEGNERGPVMLSARFFDERRYESVLVLASDRDGDFDLYYSFLEASPTLHPLDQLNSAANDVYLTLPFADDRRALFASDRDGGTYDLYEVSFETTKLAGPITSLTRVAGLSSDADDTAPYIDAARDLLVFASNRSGNYDLYCAKRLNGAWSAPRPIALANSASDEFRPSLFSIGDTHYLVFSSNRPGGAGGYDLYTVRYDDCR